jgi:hypothetical protein
MWRDSEWNLLTFLCGFQAFIVWRNTKGFFWGFAGASLSGSQERVWGY